MTKCQKGNLVIFVWGCSHEMNLFEIFYQKSSLDNVRNDRFLYPFLYLNLWNPYSFICMKPEKGTPFKKSLPLQGVPPPLSLLKSLKDFFFCRVGGSADQYNGCLKLCRRESLHSLLASRLLCVAAGVKLQETSQQANQAGEGPGTRILNLTGWLCVPMAFQCQQCPGSLCSPTALLMFILMIRICLQAFPPWDRNGGEHKCFLKNRNVYMRNGKNCIRMQSSRDSKN